MVKNIATVLHEMRQFRNSFMKKSPSYRQLNRAVKQLEKLEEIEQIVKDWNNDTEKDLEAVTAMECISQILER
jgi:arsenate reductase-like glutaredoxin family protein